MGDNWDSTSPHPTKDVPTSPLVAVKDRSVANLGLEMMLNYFGCKQ